MVSTYYLRLLTQTPSYYYTPFKESGLHLKNHAMMAAETGAEMPQHPSLHERHGIHTLAQLAPLLATTHPKGMVSTCSLPFLTRKQQHCRPARDGGCAG